MTTPISDLSSALPELDDYIPFGDVSAQEPKKQTISEILGDNSMIEQIVDVAPLLVNNDDFYFSCTDTQNDLWVILDVSGVDPATKNDLESYINFPPSPADQQIVTFSLYADYILDPDTPKLDVDLIFQDENVEWDSDPLIDTRQELSTTFVFNSSLGNWMVYSYC